MASDRRGARRGVARWGILLVLILACCSSLLRLPGATATATELADHEAEPSPLDLDEVEDVVADGVTGEHLDEDGEVIEGEEFDETEYGAGRKEGAPHGQVSLKVC